MCVPSYPGLRLWDDSAKALLGPKQKRSVMAHYSDKSRFKHPQMENDFGGQPVPLSRIYWLEPAASRSSTKIDIRPIPGPQGLVKLLESSFRLDFSGPKPLAEEFKRLVRIADTGMLYGVSFPRDFRRASEVTKYILNHIDRGSVGELTEAGRAFVEQPPVGNV